MQRRASLPVRSLLLAAAVAALQLAWTPPAFAQRGAPALVRSRHVLEPHLRPIPWGPIGRSDLDGTHPAARPPILLVGYWPPSNEMLRRFSPDPAQNPQGWIGQDWEGRGYDVYAFFPEFNPPNCSGCGKGNGDFEVDYQDTSNDWWPTADGLQPIAIITYSRGFIDKSWELEMNQFNRKTWFPDFVPQFQPTPAPPDASVPSGHKRLSQLPVEKIVRAVAAANLGLNPYVCYSGDGGGFLSEFLGYHGVWYQSLHRDPVDPAWCVTAGHVHVGGQIDWNTATLAGEVTLRTVIEYVDCVVDELNCVKVRSYCVTSPNSAGAGALLSWSGNTSISTGGLTLLASDLPPKQFGLFFYGDGETQVPLGDGQLCVGGKLRRLPVLQADASGLAQYALDYTQPPLGSGPGKVEPGSTWNFQLWYRDPAAGGTGSNASDGLRVTFCP